MISAMTNSELDRLIAERRGWRGENIDDYACFAWVNHATGKTVKNMPSFTTDPRYAFELLEEMPYPLLGKRIDEKWYCFGYEEISAHISDTAARAIAEAWLEWRGGV